VRRRRYPHVFVSNSAQPIAYTARRGGTKTPLPDRQRDQHADRLRRALDTAWTESDGRAKERGAVGLATRSGTYLEFRGAPGFDLKTRSLEDLGVGIRLLSVRATPDARASAATVYVPKGQEQYFLRKVRQYATEETGRHRPKNQPLIDSIEDIRLALVASFWQDEADRLPGPEPVWCEIWLRGDDCETESLFRDLLRQLGIRCQEGSLRFPERTVLVAEVTGGQVADLIEASDCVAELRCAKETARFWVAAENEDQTDWVRDLAGRLQLDADTQVAVCVLDSGANNGHPLLAPVLTDEDCQSYRPEWGSTDHNGHGTLVCGLAIYGDLQQALETRLPVAVSHRLESVKVLPPHGQNEPKLYGYITQQALARAEIQAPTRTHIPCMAVATLDGRDRGRPSSWSAAIDEVTSGYLDGRQRLFVVSAGNVTDMNRWRDYPDGNLADMVHDPGQAWNALTIGAYTEMTAIRESTFDGFTPVASAGQLSPHSTTSLPWEGSKWPAKPDIVMEGGNLARSPDGTLVSVCDDLSLLSTCHDYTRRQFDSVYATSAATAQAACMAAQIQAAYPEAWPETVRGLMVHAAEWTPAMQEQFLASPSKAEYARLLRICGYGVPNATRAIECAANSLTLIAQAHMRPFTKDGSRCRMKDMHVHELPWPREELLALGDVPVTMRVTLSYFIEPGPGEVGWRDRYRYPSHALRFDVNVPSETRDAFVKRLNVAAREDGEVPETGGGAARWTIGSQGRNLGSIHSDIWTTGTAADVAACSLVGVYPVVGWWRERAHLGRCNRSARYSLIVSVSTPAQDIDLYTRVATQVGIDIGL
jgi:hypothetical protein